MKNLREEINRIEREPKEAVEEYVEELLALFRQAIEEIIGSDENPELLSKDSRMQFEYANRVRDEQRERLNQIMPKE
jgi:hypothetical protein